MAFLTRQTKHMGGVLLLVLAAIHLTALYHQIVLKPEVPIPPSNSTRAPELLTKNYSRVHISSFSLNGSKGSAKPLASSHDVQWVFLLHSSGHTQRFDTAVTTWFRSNSLDVGLVLFGAIPANGRVLQNYIYVQTRHESAFDGTKRAFLTAARAFPNARMFAKFDDDSYAYTYEIVRKLSMQQNNTGGGYWGYPIKLDSLVFGSGGAGYILDRQAVKWLERCSPAKYPEFEDASVGYCLKQSGVELTDLVGLHPHHPFQMIRWDKNGHPADRLRKEPIEGYMNPLSYHYLSPSEIAAMHDDIHLHGFPRKRSSAMPKVIHQFWEGDELRRPDKLIQSCKTVHGNHGWKHITWDDKKIRQQFPSSENIAGLIGRDGESGSLINQDLYEKGRHALNLLSDIARYEFLLFFGGVYIDADSECIRPMDYMLTDVLKTNPYQGIGFLEKDEAFLDGLLASGVIFTFPFSPLAITLVSQLHYTDWNLAPWQSAGPLYFTKIVKKFQENAHNLPSYLMVRTMPSSHVFPYHYSDKRPAEESIRLASLQDVGAVMDQQWGSTHGSYHNTKKWNDLSETEKTLLDERNNLWMPLHSYTLLHRTGLSILAKKRPRWVVANLHPLAGMCDRIMHVISCLAFAMATGRTLLFDWGEQAAGMHENRLEGIGHSEYSSVFQPPPIQYDLNKALSLFEISRQQAESQGGITILDDNTEFLHALKFSDLDALYPQSFVFISRYDWWGAPLMHNDLYRKDVFLDASSQEVFSILYRFLFTPAASTPETAHTCDWFIQHRTIWERKTAPLESFLECAVAHGMRAAQHGNESGEHHMLATDAKVSTPPPAGFVAAPQGCRNGKACDASAIETMFKAANCKHAVLTYTSTFGACIAGLGRIQDAYIVKEDGSCHKKSTVDPIDAGVLSHQTMQVTNVLNDQSDPPPKCAFVFMCILPTDKAVQDLGISLRKLHQHFNHRHHYPVVLFVDNAKMWQHVQFTTSTRVHIVEMDAEEWGVPAYTQKFPEVFKLSSSPEHPGYSVQYRQMSRWSAGFLYSHKSLARFDYVIKMDSDTFAYDDWLKNPFEEMIQQKAKIGFWISYEDVAGVTVNLWETFLEYTASRGLSLRQPGLLLEPSTGRYRNTSLHGCFLGVHTASFRSQEYQDMFNFFDSKGGFFMHKWDEQKLLAFYTALYLAEEEVEYFDYVKIEHREWTREASKLNIAQPRGKAP